MSAKFLFCFLIVGVAVQVDSLNDALKGQSVLYGITSLAQDSQNSSLCHKHLHSLFLAIEDRRVWALKALDASGTPGPGFLYGNNLWLGSHAQCLDISNRRPFEISYVKVKHPEATPYDFPPYLLGFTMVYIGHNNTLQHHTQLPLEFTIQLGLCLPRSCSPEDMHDLLDDYINKKYLNIQNLFDLNLEVHDVKQLEDRGDWMLMLPKTLILLVIASVVLLMAIIGTVYDVKKHNRDKNIRRGHRGNLSNGKQGLSSVSEVELVSNSSLEDVGKTSTFWEIFKCFSIYSNVKTLVRTELPDDSVPIIHGLRFFGMLWVIMVHAVFYQADYLENVPTAYRLSEDIFSQILSNSTYCVDTYLFISGFLVGYLFLKSKGNALHSEGCKNLAKKTGEFFMMCVNRFLRLTPPYMVVMLLTDVLYTYYRKSSALHSSEFNDVVCSKYWWRNVLYINNLFPRSEMCMSWSWYLSLDSQFFAIAAFLLILSTITFKTSAILTVVLIIVNVIATIYKSYSIGYIPTMDEQLAQLDAIYDLPWNRIGPYLIGMITAYVLSVKLQKKLVLKERTRIFLWTVFPLLNLWILFTIYTRQVSVEFSAVYMGISRTLWGIGLGWLLIACCTGNARALEKFLAFRGFIPLSRLTYCAYLLNPLVANMVYLGSEASYNASLASFALTIQGITLITFYLSFVFSVLFESPFILLTKMIFSKVTAPKRKLKDTTAAAP